MNKCDVQWWQWIQQNRTLEPKNFVSYCGQNQEGKKKPKKPYVEKNVQYVSGKFKKILMEKNGEWFDEEE